MKVFVASSAARIKNEGYKKAGLIVSDFMLKGKHSWLLGGEGWLTDRIYQMEKADLIIILPGDMRTLHDLYTAIESKSVGEHQSPIVIANIEGYFDDALIMIDKSICEGFTEESVQDLYDIVHSAKELSTYLESLEKK